MVCSWQDALNPGRNRGFAFIEYYNNACADYARQQMSSGSFRLEGNTPTVTWADPKSAPDSAAASQVINFEAGIMIISCQFKIRTLNMWPILPIRSLLISDHMKEIRIKHYVFPFLSMFASSSLNEHT